MRDAINSLELRSRKSSVGRLHLHLGVLDDGLVVLLLDGVGLGGDDEDGVEGAVVIGGHHPGGGEDEPEAKTVPHRHHQPGAGEGTQ